MAYVLNKKSRNGQQKLKRGNLLTGPGKKGHPTECSMSRERGLKEAGVIRGWGGEDEKLSRRTAWSLLAKAYKDLPPKGWL